MIKLVIAFDDNDSDLGDYFEASYNNLMSSMQALNVTPTKVLKGLQCTEKDVNDAVNPLKLHPFIFVGLSHGDDTGNYLLTENDTYVTPNNAVNFSNSFFYTTGCNTGLGLREKLLEHGCKVFVGYANSSMAAYTDEFNSIFIDCELHALKQFLASDNPIGKLFNEMLEYTQTQIDLLSEKGEIIDAMFLQKNKDYYIIDGDCSLTRQHF